MSDSFTSSGRFGLQALGSSGLFAVRRSSFVDGRGSFSRLFCDQDLQAAGWRWSVAQVNLSHTSQSGTVRGMHFQRPPHTEAKLVTCLSGRVWDIAVDIRRRSSTLLRATGLELSEDNDLALLIPPGFAHGFQSLSDNATLLYLHGGHHVVDADDGLNPLDPLLGIRWPLEITTMSDKDRTRPLLAQAFEGLEP